MWGHDVITCETTYGFIVLEPSFRHKTLAEIKLDLKLLHKNAWFTGNADIMAYWQNIKYKISFQKYKPEIMNHNKGMHLQRRYNYAVESWKE